MEMKQTGMGGMRMGHSNNAQSKRPRTEKAEQDPHHPSPSQVVFVRSLLEGVTEHELYQMLVPFGPINEIHMMPQKHQALVEFAEIDHAKRLMQGVQSGEKILICGKEVFLNYSTSAKITRPEVDGAAGSGSPASGASSSGMVKGANAGPSGKVLLFTIYNVSYPITLDVVHTICHRHAKVLRIVFIRKGATQVMVEFENYDDARRVKQALNGADIYSGCCSLKVEHARPASLTVSRNDQDSWDFTIERSLPQKSPSFSVEKYPTPLLRAPGATPNAFALAGASPAQGMQHQPFMGVNGASNLGVANMHNSAYGMMYNMGVSPMQTNEANGYNGATGGGMGVGVGVGLAPGGMQGYAQQLGTGANNQMMGAGANGDQSSNSVIVVQNLPRKLINTDRLFNLLCLYGNVLRIKFLLQKDGWAMVQMGDAQSAQRVISTLGSAQPEIFGSRLRIEHSYHAQVKESAAQQDLEDGSPSFKDFSGSKYNRFTSNESLTKNRIIAPSVTLHFYNAPPSISDQQLLTQFLNLGAKAPVHVLKFSNKSGSEKSSSGLLEFESVSAACEALVLANHAQIESQESKYPYTLKLAFSNAQQVGQNQGQSEQAQGMNYGGGGGGGSARARSRNSAMGLAGMGNAAGMGQGPAGYGMSGPGGLASNQMGMLSSLGGMQVAGALGAPGIGNLGSLSPMMNSPNPGAAPAALLGAAGGKAGAGAGPVGLAGMMSMQPSHPFAGMTPTLGALQGPPMPMAAAASGLTMPTMPAAYFGAYGAPTNPAQTPTSRNFT